jgi:hypothetical protein
MSGPLNQQSKLDWFWDLLLRRFDLIFLGFALGSALFYVFGAQCAKFLIFVCPAVRGFKLPDGVDHGLDQLSPNLICGVFIVWLGVRVVNRLLRLHEEHLWEPTRMAVTRRLGELLVEFFRAFDSCRDDAKQFYRCGSHFIGLLPDLLLVDATWTREKMHQESEIINDQRCEEIKQYLERVLVEIDVMLPHPMIATDPDLAAALNNFAACIRRFFWRVRERGADAMSLELREGMRGLDETLPPLTTLFGQRAERISDEQRREWTRIAFARLRD